MDKPLDRLTLPLPIADWLAALPEAPFTVTAECGQSHGLSGVWQLQNAQSQTVYLKAATRADKGAQEVHAYARWVRPAFGPQAPYVLAQSENPRALLLSSLPGVCMESLNLSPAHKRAAWHEAGALLRRLHALETGSWFGGVAQDGSLVGETFTDAAQYLARKIEEWCERGLRAGSLRSDEATFARAVAPEWTAAMQDELPVPCHRDYTPRNWIAAPETGAFVGVIDFEHTRWDVRANDMSRPWTREFLEQPDLADAFFDGYRGGPPDARLWAQIRAVRLLGCIGTTVWGLEHGDEKYSEEGRAGLRVLQAETGRKENL